MQNVSECSHNNIVRTDTSIDVCNRCRVGFVLCDDCGAELERVEIGRHDVEAYVKYLKLKAKKKQ